MISKILKFTLAIGVAVSAGFLAVANLAYILRKLDEGDLEDGNCVILFFYFVKLYNLNIGYVGLV